jgi:hypothetical protein
MKRKLRLMTTMISVAAMSMGLLAGCGDTTSTKQLPIRQLWM